MKIIFEKLMIIKKIDNKRKMSGQKVNVNLQTVSVAQVGKYYLSPMGFRMPIEETDSNDWGKIVKVHTSTGDKKSKDGKKPMSREELMESIESVNKILSEARLEDGWGSDLSDDDL